MRQNLIRRGFLKFARTTHGNAGVEFALLLPLLVMLLFGGIEVGRALHDFHVVNETVRDAARYMSRVPGVDCTAGAGSFLDVAGETFTAAAHLERARAIAMTGDVDTAPPAPDLLGYWNYPAQKSSVDISVYCIANVDTDPDPLVEARAFQGFYANDDFVPHVVLTADVPFTFLFGGLVAAEPTINITLSHNVVVIGQ
jgi:hypothetical protein